MVMYLVDPALICDKCQEVQGRNTQRGTILLMIRLLPSSSLFVEFSSFLSCPHVFKGHMLSKFYIVKSTVQSGVNRGLKNVYVCILVIKQKLRKSIAVISQIPTCCK